MYGQRGNFKSNQYNLPTGSNCDFDTLYQPTGVALDKRGQVYIVDSYNYRVLVFVGNSTDATRVYGQATFVTRSNGVNPAYFALPSSVAVDSKDNVFVADVDASRVMMFPAASTTASVVFGQWNSMYSAIVNNGGISAYSLYKPTAVVVDAENNLYVADTWNQRVLFYPQNFVVATKVWGQ